MHYSRTFVSHLRLKIPGPAALAVILICSLACCAQAQVADRTTLTGRILCGYQGWFSTPCADGSGGWDHWSKSREDIGPGLHYTDMWPDTTEYDPADLCECPNVTLISGKKGYLFSNSRQGVTNTHFRWMQENNIDGVFVGRFVLGVGMPNPGPETRLQHIMSAALKYGRVISVAYDITGTPASELYPRLTADWTHLTNDLNLKNHPRYQLHNGKPMVMIWGLGAQPHTAAQAQQIIDWFKNEGCFVIGGVSTSWRSQAQTDPAWANVYHSFDGLSPWSVGAFMDWGGIQNFMNSTWIPDAQDCSPRGQIYMPVVWPRFGWNNMHDYACDWPRIPPRGGQHLWDQLYAVKNAYTVTNYQPAQTMLLAMFDEYDESTAIMKMADDVPNAGCWFTNEGLPNDWWLRLTNYGGKMLRNEITLSQTMPIGPTSSPDNATIVSNTIPSTMNLGQQYSVSVTVQNTGETCWNAEFFKLRAVGNYDPCTTTLSHAIATGLPVLPGGQATFTLTMKAPVHNGVYVTDWQMSHELIRMFGAKLQKVITVGTGAALSATSAFASTTDGWTTSTWRAGTGSLGSMAFSSSTGNPTGGMRCAGASSTDNTDRCAREGGEIQKTISTAGYQGITVSYDLKVSTLGQERTGVGTGTCTVDHNMVDEQLTVYYSTNGGTSWTEADTIARSELKASYQTAWGTRVINLADVTACNNNANFRLRFRWQLNTTGATGDYADLDNIKVYANQIDVTPPGSLGSFAASGGNQQVALTWTNPSDPDYTGAVVRYRTDAYPTSTTDGTLLGDKPGSAGTADGVVHTSLTTGRTYYYAAFAHDDGPHYASAVTSSGATVPGVTDDWPNESFDSYASGFLTSPKWITIAQSCSEVQSSVTKGGSGKAAMMDATASWGPIANQISFSDKTAGYCYLSFDIAQDATGTTGEEMGSVAIYGSDSQAEIAKVHVQKGRLMVEYNSESFAILTASASNLSWYNAKLGFNIDTRRMDFWLDGIVKGTGYDWKGNATRLSSVVILSDRNLSLPAQKVYIDNLKLEPKLGQVGEVRDDGVWTPSLSKLHFAFDPVAYTPQYRYCIGTISGGSQTRAWTVCGTSTDVMATGLTMAENQNYYVTVQCGDANGNWGASRTSDGIKVAPGLATISAAKALPDSAAVYALRGKVVSAAFSGFFYIEEPASPFGIKVVSPAAVISGDQIDVAGAINGSGAERLIDCAGNAVLKTTPGPGGPDPVVVSTAALGGVELNTYTPGVVDGTSANNIGLYVRVCGKVTQRQTIPPVYLYVDDGCGLRDGTTTSGEENVGVRVVADPDAYAVGDFVSVTGISSCFNSSGMRRQILPSAISILNP